MQCIHISTTTTFLFRPKSLSCLMNRSTSLRTDALCNLLWKRDSFDTRQLRPLCYGTSSRIFPLHQINSLIYPINSDERITQRLVSITSQRVNNGACYCADCRAKEKRNWHQNSHTRFGNECLRLHVRQNLVCSGKEDKISREDEVGCHFILSSSGGLGKLVRIWGRLLPSPSQTK